MAKRHKLRKCSICRKSPVWQGGDVKNPGPYCKKCYHKHVWSDRPGERDEQSVADDCVDFLSGMLPDAPYYMCERLPEARHFLDDRLPEAGHFLNEPLPEPPRYRYPDEDEWAWICHAFRGKFENRPERHWPLDPYPDEDEWTWICHASRDE